MAAAIIGAAVSGAVSLFGQHEENDAREEANASMNSASQTAQGKLNPYAQAGEDALAMQGNLLKGYRTPDYDPNSILSGYEDSGFYEADQEAMGRSQEALLNKFSGQMGGNAVEAITSQAGRTSNALARTYVGDVQQGRRLGEASRQRHMGNVSRVAANGQNAAGAQGTIGTNYASGAATNSVAGAHGMNEAFSGFGDNVSAAGMGAWKSHKRDVPKGNGFGQKGSWWE